MVQSQGRRADHWPITKTNTALIVVDMQNIWVHPRGARYLSMSEDIVPKIQELLRFCHSKRVPVFYLHTTKRRDLADVGIFADIKPQTHDADDEWSNFEGTIGRILRTGKARAGDVRSRVSLQRFYGTQLENLLRPWAAIPSPLPAWRTCLCDSTARAAPCAIQSLIFIGLNASFSREDRINA